MLGSARQTQTSLSAPAIPGAFQRHPKQTQADSGKRLWRRANEAPPTPPRAGPSQELLPKAGLCPKCRGVPLVAPALQWFQPSLCFPPSTAACSWRAPGVCRGWGEKGFFQQLQPGKTRREAPRWPLPFLAQHGQEHELQLWHRVQGSGATCPAPAGPPGPKHPQKSPEGFMGLMQPSRSCSLCLGFFSMTGFLGVG